MNMAVVDRKVENGRAIARSMPVIAKVVCRNFGVKVFFDAGGVPYADPRGVHLPASLKAVGTERDAILLNGFLDHEAAHVRYSDFNVGTKCRTPFEKTLVNIIEDIRIERLIGEAFPGCKKNLAAVTLLLDADTVPSEADSPADILMGWLSASLRKKELGHQTHDGLFDIHARQMLGKKLRDDIMQIATQGSRAPSTLDVLYAVQKIVDLLSESAKQQQQQEQQQQQGAAQHPESGSSAPSDADDEVEKEAEHAADADDDEDEQQQNSSSSSDQDMPGNSSSDDDERSPSTPQDPSGSKGDDPASGGEQQDKDGQQARTSSSQPGSPSDDADQQSGDHGFGGNSAGQSAANSDGDGDSSSSGSGGSQSDGAAGGSSSGQREQASSGQDASSGTSPGTSGGAASVGNQDDGSSTSSSQVADGSAVGCAEPICDAEAVAQALQGAGADKLAEALKEAMEGLIGTQATNCIEEENVRLSQLTARGRYINSDTQRAVRIVANQLDALLWSKLDEQRYTTSTGRMNANLVAKVVVGSDRVFEKREEAEGLNTAVKVLYDVSGSMDYAKRKAATETAAIVTEACSRYDVAVSVAAFDDEIFPIKSFDDEWRQVGSRIDHVRGDGGTLMGAVHAWSVGEIVQQPQERKIVLIATDGLPNSFPGLAASVAEAARYDIETRFVLIGANELRAKQFHAQVPYATHVAAAEKGDDIPHAILACLKGGTGL